MNLAVYEWRKLFRLPALWAFLALCLAFNGLLIATLSPYDRAFFNETSRAERYTRHREPGFAASICHRDGGHFRDV